MTMQARFQVLQRLVTLYGVLEETQAAELTRVTAAATEVEELISADEKVERSARANSQAALHSGTQLDWQIANTEQNAAASRIELLEQVRQERTRLREEAMDQYVASRMRREQMKRLSDDTAQGIEYEQRRRGQSASDDYFLTRRRWIDVREERRLTR